MKEKIEILIKELRAENDKLSKQLVDKPDMIWTYKSSKMATRGANESLINKLKTIL